MNNPPPALSDDALMGKSRVYIQKALARKDSNDFDEYQLWASLALELIGKARLAAIHPSLIADPIHPASLFAASGIVTSTDIKTINAHTIFDRLKIVVEGFDERTKDFCIEIAQRRNSELHSGEASFQNVRAEAWESKYWHAVDLILKSMGSTLDEWIGGAAAVAPKALLDHARRARADAASIRIERAREAFSKLKKNQRDPLQSRASRMSDRERALLFNGSFDGIWTCPCPACGSMAAVAGEQVEEEVLDQSYGEYDAWETVLRTYSADELHCPACGLDLNGYDEIEASEIETTHASEEEREMTYEPEYNNE